MIQSKFVERKSKGTVLPTPPRLLAESSPNDAASAPKEHGRLPRAREPQIPGKIMERLARELAADFLVRKRRETAPMLPGTRCFLKR